MSRLVLDDRTQAEPDPSKEGDFVVRSPGAQQVIVDPSESDLSSMSAGPRDRRIALGIVALSAFAFAAAIPFARVPLLPVPAFIPAYEAALAINDLITAALLFGQLNLRRPRALVVLASAYLFDALIIVPHALTFPGVISSTGILGAGPQTTAWLYMFWHGGFPIFVIAYGLLAERDMNASDTARDRRWMAVGGASVAIAAAICLTALATAGQDVLPAIMEGGGYTPVMKFVISSTWLLSVAALVLLWRRRSPTVLDLWLMVVMCAWVFDIALSAVFNGGRFDLGFYGGRIYGLFAASFVLIALLLETKELHERLAVATRRIRGHARELEARVATRTSELAHSNESLAIEVAERKRAAQELLRIRRFLDVIIESIPATIVVKDAKDGKHLLINRAAEEVMGYDRSAVVGRTLYDLFPKAEADEVDAHDREALSSVRPHETREITLVAGNRGARVLRRTCVPVRDESGEALYVLGLGEDITERRQIEAQLHHAQKMEAIGNLTGGMAHDFNNLLAVVIGNLDVLRSLMKENATVDDLAGEALDAALRGADLTRRLLAFARNQPLKPAPIDANHLVDDITTLLARTIGEQIKVVVKLTPNVWPVIADPAQLEAALANLATNARDAMPEGGELTIVTGNRQLDADYTALYPEVVPGDYAMIEVSDTGTGMPPEVVARIFEPFFTTKGEGKGTGLGLAMVFGFMKQSGGHINVYSEPGVGTTFRLYLPRAEAAAAVETAAKTEEIPLGKGERVLAVEDNGALRRIVVRQLTELGYHVLEAENAVSALALLEKQPVDLLFTDVIMPGELSGLQLVRFASSRWPNLRIVLTSGFPGTKLGGSLEATRTRLLSKPYRKADLARELRAALEG